MRDKLARASRLLGTLTFHYNVILSTMFAWGVYAVFFGEPPTAVSQETSHATYMLFVAIHVLAPLTIWTGQLIRVKRVQWWLRWAGDSALFVMIATHVLALDRQASRGVPGTVYLLFVLAALAFATFCIAGRDLYKAISSSTDRCDK